MAILEGHNGKITFLPDGSDTAVVLSVVDTTKWVLNLDRIMVETTPHNSGVTEWLPSHGKIVLDFEGFIDQDINPGEFNQLAAVITLQPNRPDMNKNIEFNGWTERIVWESGVGLPNMVRGRIRGTGDATQTWT